jgi:hypothetical protein
MHTYLVRVRGLAGLEYQNIVGIVRASGPMNLWEVMDEFDNPHDYEFLRLRGECACVFIGSTSSPLLGESTCEQLPDEEDIAKSKRWQTIIEMVGGKEKFIELYGEEKGHPYVDAVAKAMGCAIPEQP